MNEDFKDIYTEFLYEGGRLVVKDSHKMLLFTFNTYPVDWPVENDYGYLSDQIYVKYGVFEDG